MLKDMVLSLFYQIKIFVEKDARTGKIISSGACYHLPFLVCLLLHKLIINYIKANKNNQNIPNNLKNK